VRDCRMLDEYSCCEHGSLCGRGTLANLAEAPNKYTKSVTQPCQQLVTDHAHFEPTFRITGLVYSGAVSAPVPVLRIALAAITSKCVSHTSTAHTALCDQPKQSAIGAQHVAKRLIILCNFVPIVEFSADSLRYLGCILTGQSVTKRRMSECIPPSPCVPACVDNVRRKTDAGKTCITFHFVFWEKHSDD
jgi:hypothetical protein